MKLKRPVSEFAQRIYELRVDKVASQCDIADAIGEIGRASCRERVCQYV